MALSNILHSLQNCLRELYCTYRNGSSCSPEQLTAHVKVFLVCSSERSGLQKQLPVQMSEYASWWAHHTSDFQNTKCSSVHVLIDFQWESKDICCCRGYVHDYHPPHCRCALMISGHLNTSLLMFVLISLHQHRNCLGKAVLESFEELYDFFFSMLGLHAWMKPWSRLHKACLLACRLPWFPRWYHQSQTVQWAPHLYLK